MTIHYIAYQVVHQHTEESLAVPCLQVSHGRGESGILASNMSSHWVSSLAAQSMAHV